MAINWKSRENVFRLLAAVYAELGEAGLKGRYASIAKFYGPDATYDAIKSFFGKEITKAADELMAQNPGHQRTSKVVPQKSKASRRHLHLDFNDQDLSFISEREVEAHSRHALQRPPKRPRIRESSQLQGPEEVDTIVVQESNVAENIPIQVQLYQYASVNGHEEVHAMEPQLPQNQREMTSISTDPEYFPSPSPSFRPPSRPQAPPRKRPYKDISEFELEHQNISSSSQNSIPAVEEAESFGYVTNAGYFRCALCFSQLSSQEALDKHETLSKLHMRNLQNPAMLSKGRAKLAQVTALPYHRPYGSSASPAAFRPLRLGGFDTCVRRETIIGDMNATSWTDTTSSSNPSSSNRLIGQAEQAAAETSSTVDTSEQETHTKPIQDHSEERRHDLEAQLQSEVSKGKGRASLPPQPEDVDPDPLHEIITLRGAPLDNVQHHPQQTRIDEPAPSKNQAPEPPVNNQPDTTDIPPAPSRSMKPPSRLRPLEVAEILRLTGIRLAEQYIAEHPDLIDQTMGRVQREFTAASTAASGNDGSVGPRGVSLGLTEVLQAVREEERARRTDHGRTRRDGPPLAGPGVAIPSGTTGMFVQGNNAGAQKRADGVEVQTSNGKNPVRRNTVPQNVVVLD